jgi:hypothetical protein
MSILLFVTDDGRSMEGTGPMLVIRNEASATLPPHPRGYAWRYFATLGLDDAMLADERDRIADALANGLPYLLRRLVFAPPLLMA